VCNGLSKLRTVLSSLYEWFMQVYVYYDSAVTRLNEAVKRKNDGHL